ncbi:peptide deformylase [Candidatus Uhrbacteria bacterium RIFCSPHIGHO2_12_FULL_60_25]|uniref:Peptide deformylase n=1 Tax=Candidatus Uhrbacteria bacterium RIFCSPHIGHO2_12_FULL_60_25 TaxID=1802399 RepID=A0A1F7UN17_9BACT|nr:MAG: peptide deformylase [Candidatus Uhrbacteria bacterium RIFCSPHIGHO2_02_FULL_60_44]OGL79098.1 MAG: peptide deformylase [Candidatus Uhrbacteria bacterium RIFCSPHIGHO2_12_FULL_60_25]
MNQTWTILTDPNPELRKRSRDVDVAIIHTPEFQKFADDFAAFMVSSDGVGLAAPQIGRMERIIAVQEREKVVIYLNPEIVKSSSTMQTGEEGCLSVPGKFGMVERHKRIRVRAVDRHGREVEFDASGFPAVVFQHEIDHLNGVLFTDKVKEYTRGESNVKV